MIQKISRRLSLKLLSLGTLFGIVKRDTAEAQDAKPEVEDLNALEIWDKTHDRVFLGGEVWANPMEDWRVVDGRAECQTDAANRSIHSLTHQITNPEGSFRMTVSVRQPDEVGRSNGAGFRVGIRSDLNEHRSNTFAKGGIDAGVKAGQLVVGKEKIKLEAPEEFILILTGESLSGKTRLTLTARSSDGKELGSVSGSVNSEEIVGNIALVSQFSGPKNRGDRKGYSFANWEAGGDAFTVSDNHRFGPLLWSMYTLSDSRSDEGFVMKLSALTGPLGDKDNQEVELFTRDQTDEWKSRGTASLDHDAWTATFRLTNWDQTKETPYKLVYRETHRDGSESASEWTGMIQQNPEGRPLRLGALTCQNDYAFPYEPVANSLAKLKPDMLYFSGDQLYESHGGFGIIRDPAGPAILSYLRKYYQFGWSFREAMAIAPTVCLPDDHDVFQGNIWGEDGAPMKDISKGASSKGGYREPARMVNVVHKTNTAHHPAPYDPNPSLQDISVYYGTLLYGGVSFAILGDRQWKSGPEKVDTGSGRADHVLDPDFDTSALDKPGLVLLGERQEKFLEEWGKDWESHNMKVLLSQTVFSGVATHHGKFDGYLKADLDSGAWPQTARNNAIRILRKSEALHINGDQHLTTLSQYGVDKQRDSNWSFCTPAIAAGYPRWWRPDDVGMPHQNRPKHGHGNTGEYLDGCGNKTYVYAVGNPEVATEKNRYAKAHQKGSGLGLVTIDTEKKTYTLDSFRFLVDPTDGNPENQFPGWPVTIHRRENGGDNVLG